MTGESDPSAKPSVTKRFESPELGIIGSIGGQGDAPDSEIAGENVERRHHCLIPAQRPIENQQAARSCGFHELRESRAADGIKYQVGALAVCEPLYLAYDILLLGGYNRCRPTLGKPAEFIHLCPGASESDRPCAEAVGDLDGGEADAT
jgi:hypothetical protein